MSRSAAARLLALEAQEAARAGRVEAEAAKEDAGHRAGLLLPPDVRRDVLTQLDAQAAGGALWADTCRAAVALEDRIRRGGGQQLEDPDGEAARAWEAGFWKTPSGQPAALPPAGAAGYFEREAVVCGDAGRALPLEGLPDGVSLEDCRRALRWAGAGWAWKAGLVRVMLGEL